MPTIQHTGVYTLLRRHCSRSKNDISTSVDSEKAVAPSVPKSWFDVDGTVLTLIDFYQSQREN